MTVEEFNSDDEYALAMDRAHTIGAILSLDRRFTREYLNTISNLDALHDLEEGLILTQYET